MVLVYLIFEQSPPKYMHSVLLFYYGKIQLKRSLTTIYENVVVKNQINSLLISLFQENTLYSLFNVLPITLIYFVSYFAINN